MIIKSWFGRGLEWKIGGCVALAAVLSIGVSENVLAQIVPDKTLGVEGSVVKPNVNIQGIPSDRIDGGATRGANLFHSFQDFNVGEGRGAYFANPAGIENILTRVTGNNPSNILGRLGVLGGANLFLLNPNGIVFGPNASLDIQGSFMATTADHVQLGDSGYFSASQPQTSSLLSVSPGALFFSQVANQPTAIINQGNLSTGKHLTLSAGNLDLQGQLQAGGDLKLQAQDRVKVRDSVTTPFLAQAGGNLIIGGNQGIDILALNHPTLTSFVSRGDFSLISDGIISGDARFASGGNFSLKSISGGLANFVSLYDPIISSNGDVDVAANYTGSSLLVESKGNIRFQGDINITTPDTSALPAGQDSANLSKSTALIMRSGQNNLAYGGVNSGSVPALQNGTVPEGITLGGNVTLQPFNSAGGIVSLTTALGNVSTQSIFTNEGNISLKATNGSITTGNLDSSSRSDSGNTANGGDISLEATNGSITTGNLDSSSGSASGNAANGGNISLEATNGSITTDSLFSYSYSESGSTGDGGEIGLLAANNIITGDFISGSRSNSSGSTGNGGEIDLITTNGTILIGDLISESYSTNSGSGGNGGAIAFTALGNITTGGMNSEAGGTGKGGDITFKSIAGAIDTDGGAITSQIRDNSDGTGNAGAIAFTAQKDIQTATVNASAEKGNGGSIQLTSNNGMINTTAGDLATDSRSGNGGEIRLTSSTGSIFTGDFYSDSDSGSDSAGQGGAISLFATEGSIKTGNLYSYSGSCSCRFAGDGGKIHLQALKGEITTGDLNSYSRSNSGSAGNGGTVALTASGNITTGGINSQASGSDHGGDITLRSNNGAINTTKGTVTSQIQNNSGGTGNGGAIAFTASGDIQTATVDASAEKGDGGNIQLTSTNGAINTTKGTLYTDSRNGNGGAISLKAPDGSITTSDLLSYSYSTSGNVANGGQISLEAGNGSINSTGLYSYSYSTSGSAKNGGAISLKAANSITTAGLFSYSNSGVDSGGNGGAINLTATDGNIYTNNLYSYSQFNSGIAGNGGAIDLRAAKGSIFTDDLYSVSYSDSTLKGNGGNGGAIAFTALGNITTGGINSEVFGAGNGGDINLTSIAGAIDTTRGTITSQIREGSNGTGRAGAIAFTASGDIQTATVNASAEKGDGGKIYLNAGLGDIKTGFLASYSSSNAAGNGGDITISAVHGNIATTGDLLSYSGDTKVLNSSYAGTGGAITLDAGENINTLSLNSGSSASRKTGAGGAITLSAGASINTQSLESKSYAYSDIAGTGGAITLDAGKNINTLFLDSGSQTNFGTASTGGAITLDAGENINTLSLDSGSYSSNGDTAGIGGAITLDAEENINTLSLNSGSLAFYGKTATGGAITLSAGANIYIGSLNSYSYSSDGDTAGTGGAITLSADDTINFQEYDFSTKTYNLNSRGSINSSGATGSGNITIKSNAPFVFNNGAISSDTFGSGKAGDIQIRATSISLTNGAQLSASSHSLGAGGNITLVASDTVELTGETTSKPEGIFENYTSTNVSSNIVGLPPGTYLGAYIPNGTFQFPSALPTNFQLPSGTVFPSGVFSQKTVSSTGSPGNLKIETGRLIINNGAAIATTTFGKNSNAGDISIRASDSIKIDSGSILSGVAPNAIGNSGKVEMSTSSLELTNSGIVQTQTLGEGVAGNIVVDADTVSISNKGSALRSASGGINELLPGTSSSSKIGGGGNINVRANNLQVTDGAVLDATTVTNSTGGDITVSANTLSVDKGGQILTSTSGTGDAGSITVNATQIQLSDSESGLLAQTTSAGKAGDLTIQPHGDGQSLRVLFQKGAQISASTSGNGQGGNLSVKAPQAVTINGNGHLSVETTGAGKAGDVTLTTDTLNINNGATVSATAIATATISEPSGSISVNANQVNLSGTGSGLLAETQGAADAGSLSLQPSNNGQSLTVNLQDNAQISASTSSSGQGGNLFVTAPQAVTIKGNGQLSVETSGAGVAGNLTIDTQRLTIQDGAQVSASTSSPNSNGVGGNIRVNATQSLDLSNGVRLLAESNGAAPAGKVTINTGNLTATNNSTIATSSELSSGGDITITASDIRLFGDSDIRTNVASGAGGGGNIKLTANSIIAFDDSDILAYADDDGGKGGNITLDTRAFFGENYSPVSSRNDPPNTLDGNNRVDVNATGAINGVITLPDVSFIQNSLNELPENQINTDSLLANSCIVRRNQPTKGSFTITGTGGLPQRPGDAQMSSFPTVDIETLPSDSTLSTTNPNRPWQKGDPIVEPQGVYRLSNGELVMSRECS
ncbi:Large exoprotein involved in heme utilization or adhesion (plasmid) [Nostoc flagelliforme CCNUN1]|uniref:Large exoprotein involved in heme utilization or adhesion n=1 Tax=Nostoc flagelliforme CCNUN1 TaxID=2038116 RepID=A0A2K8T672_9NOSO|nr:filamentous hemagglutinin N-terminal domain-containing protein [Nostoc flagelliforme]AUB43194.1 Large exoprotein involved in heme utilization or adhesion [Nostoc flagelliforme CCNUN1]